MNLNLHIIFDALSHYQPIAHINESIELDLEKARILKNDTVLEAHCLYLADTRTLFHWQGKLPVHNVIGIGAPYSGFDPQSFMNIIVIPDPCDIITLYQEIQALFEQYNAWQLQMMDSIICKRGLQDLLDIGAAVLNNPIALFDGSFVFMMMSGQLPDNYQGTIWEDVINTGYAPYDKIPFTEQKRAHEVMESMPDQPFFFKHQETDPNTQIIANLFVNHKRFGILGLIDICSPFTCGLLSLVYHLKNIIEYALQNIREYHSDTEDSIYWIDRLIQGFAIEDKIIQYHLAKRNWQQDDAYFILNFRTPDHQIDVDLLKIYMNKIKKMITDSIIFTFENSIILVVRATDGTIADEHLFHKLDQLVDSFGLKYGRSMVFSDFTAIKYFYIQSKIALTEGLQRHPRQTHFIFDDYYADHVVHSLSYATSLRSLCHPKILMLMQSDQANQTDYINTLFTYLQNGKNIQRTADKLFVHRNTLCYRLNKIESLLEIPLDDEKSLFHIYFSCILTEYL